MKKIKKQIQKFFEFSHTEIRGFFILFMIMVLALLTPFLLAFFEEENSLTFEQEQKTLDSLVVILEEQKQIIQDIKLIQKDTSEQVKEKKTSFTKTTISYPIVVKKVKKIETFELNQADTIQLRQIRGIGEKLSKRIIKYRNKLGGFYQQNQLYEVYGLDSVVISRLIKYSVMDTNLVIKQKINQPLDKSFFKELLKHPYLNYKDVKAIFKHHKEQGVFQTKAELEEVLGNKKANQLYPYIDFSY